MERLTERERNVDGTGVAKEEITDGLLKPFADKILTKLAVYEDLEEQGLLVRLPCNVGDTVYRVNAGAKQPIIPMTVSEIHFLCYKNERAVRFDAIGKEDMGESCYRLEDIGRIVFLTREEAVKKLEELKMKFKEFAKWCNERACDGCWGMLEAMACIDLIGEVKKVPFWKREKFWKENYEQQVLEEIINPIEKKLEEVQNDKT